MIANRDNPEVQAKMQREVFENSVSRSLCEAIDQSVHQFEVVTQTAGFEVHAADPLPSGLPNRARIKVFSPRPGHTLVFFYKKSLVPYSRDRYSYGGIDLKEGELNPAEISEWLTFVSSGFHPEKRPAQLRRAFPYEIPE
jgi:hypothetical protein